MKIKQKGNNREYTKEDFLKDLRKVCRPVKKEDDKQKSSSGKT